MRILSDKYSPDTTSNIAAGIFSWGPNQPDKKLGKNIFKVYINSTTSVFRAQMSVQTNKSLVA